MMTLRNSYTAYNKLLLGAILNLELKVSGDVLSLSQYLMSDFYYFFLLFHGCVQCYRGQPNL